MGRFSSKSEALYVELQPLACKSSGDGACGLHAVTHSIADLCKEAEENEKIMPDGDAGTAKRYRNLKKRLQERVLPYYQKTYPNADIDDFINDFVTASPDRLESLFSPVFRDLMAEHIARLPAAEFEHLKSELNNPFLTHAQYQETLLAKYPNNWFGNKELGYILEELNLQGRLYMVDKNDSVRKFPLIGSPHRPGDPLYAGEIGLINYSERHWEWLATNAKAAALHNKTHSGAALYFGAGSKSAAKSSTSSGEEASKLQQMPEAFKGIFEKLGFKEDSVFGKAIAVIMNFVMAIFGVVRTIGLQMNPDQPFDAAELQISGAKELERASTALGEEQGKGLRAAFRNAKTSEAQEALLRDVIKRLADNKQYALADELLKSQEAELLKKAHNIESDLEKVAEPSATAMVHNMVETCEQVMEVLAKDEFFSEGSDSYKRENFEERLNLLKEGWNIQKNVGAIIEPGTAFKAHYDEANTLLVSALNKMETILQYEKGGKKHPGKEEAESELLAARKQMAAVEAEEKAFEETAGVSIKAMLKSVDRITAFVPAHAEHIERERAKRFGGDTSSAPRTVSKPGTNVDEVD